MIDKTVKWLSDEVGVNKIELNVSSANIKIKKTENNYVRAEIIISIPKEGVAEKSTDDLYDAFSLTGSIINNDTQFITEDNKIYLQSNKLMTIELYVPKTIQTMKINTKETVKVVKVKFKELYIENAERVIIEN